MSGICSRHRHHEPSCHLCCAVPPIDEAKEPIDGSPLESVVHRLTWDEIRNEMIRGVPLAWKRTPGEVQKRALFLGVRRLHSDASLIVTTAETRGDIRVEVGEVTNGMIDSFVCSLRSKQVR